MTTSEVKKFCCSIDGGGEQYWPVDGPDCLTREGALSAGITASEEAGAAPGEEINICTGVVRTGPMILRSGDGAKSVGEHIAELVDGLLFEIDSDDPVVALTEDQQRELGTLVIDFLERVNAVKRFGVDDVREHIVMIPFPGDEKVGA